MPGHGQVRGGMQCGKIVAYKSCRRSYVVRESWDFGPKMCDLLLVLASSIGANA